MALRLAVLPSAFCALLAAHAMAQTAPAKILDLGGQTLDLNGEVRDHNGRVLDIVAHVLSMEVKESPKQVVIELPADILFDFDKSDIRPSAEAALKQAADILRQRARGGAEIDGHTDGKGAAVYNQKLSEQRAESVRRWLAEREGLKTKFSTRGFGITKPVAPNQHPDGSDDPDGRQKNRRVEIIFMK